jgi:type IV pilus assembly protein PilA
MHKAMKEKDEGFTLIELLVVIIIIGILAAIAIPVFLNQRKKGVDASMKSDLRTVANEEETYFTDNQAYVAAAAATGPASITVGADAVKLSGGNTVSVILNAPVGVVVPTAYCVKAVNTGGSHTWVYISSQGGLQPAATVACPGPATF